MQNLTRTESWITAPKAARLLGITPRTLVKLALPCLEIKQGQRTIRRYREAVIHEYERKNTANT